MKAKFPVFAVLLAISSSAFAVENNLPVVSAIPATVKEGETFSLLFSGTSPDGCGIVRDSVAVVGDQITVRYKRGGSPNTLCTQALVPFRLPITVFTGNETAKAGTYKVRIELAALDGGDTVSTKLLSFALVPVAKAGRNVVVPESGHWNFEVDGPYPTSGSGISFSIERQNDMVVSLTNFYNADGSPEWYINSGKLIANTLSSEYFTVSGGQSLFSAYKPPKSVEYTGNVLFEFASPTRGTAWIMQPIDSGLLSGLKVMPISIARFNYGFGAMSKALNGRWVLASEGQSSIESKTLEFQSIADTGNTMANYAAGEYRLNCSLEVSRPNVLNDVCTLTKNGLIVANFDQVGYSRMRGTDNAAKNVSLFRVD
jgi:hypothetical protein